MDRVTIAVDRNTAKKLKNESELLSKNKDKRNLYLAAEGLKAG